MIFAASWEQFQWKMNPNHKHTFYLTLLLFVYFLRLIILHRIFLEDEKLSVNIIPFLDGGLDRRQKRNIVDVIINISLWRHSAHISLVPKEVAICSHPHLLGHNLLRIPPLYTADR